MQMQPIARYQPECRSHLGGYHQATLLSQYQRGIHRRIMPRLQAGCDDRKLLSAESSNRSMGL